MTITERIKQESRMISRPLYVFLGKDELKQLHEEKPKEAYFFYPYSTNEEILCFDLMQIIEVNKKSFFLVAG